MRLRFVLFLIASALLSQARGSAVFAQAGPLDPVLDACDGDPVLRARLLSVADSVAAADPALASEALSIVGQSFARRGELDSAVVCYQRAMDLDPREPRRTELAGALLSRLGTNDAARARDVLRPVQPITPQYPDPSQAATQGLFAWALFLSAQPDSAMRLLAPIDTWLSAHGEWRYRLACVAFDREEWIRVQLLLTPLGVASRTYDADVMDMLERSADKLNAKRRLQPMLTNEIHKRDEIEQEWVTEMGGRRVGFRSRDGFPLGGTVLKPRRAAHPRGAVVLMAPGDTVAIYDSLAAGLRDMGLAVMLLEPRGSGRSVAPSCPLPSAWHGREAAMQEAVAGDVSAAASALAREAGADSTQYLVVGVGSAGPSAILAARKDRRVRSLMLVSPSASPCDRGMLRAQVAAWKRPIYFQTGPEDFTAGPLIDALYQATDMRASRVADSDKPGTRATIFRRDPRIMARFKQWLSESWPRSAAPRPTPPPPPKKG
jgi:dienelactone hydrolase